MLRHHLRVAIAALKRRPAFTAIAVVGIALSLGLVLTVAALLDAAFGAHPPDAAGDRALGLYQLRFSNDEGSRMTGPAGSRFIDLTMRDLPGVEDVAVAQTQNKRTTFQTGRREEFWFKRTDAAFWRVMRFEFLEGRPFSEADDRTGQTVAVVGQRLAYRLFGGEALGKTLRIGVESYRVIGVVEDVSFLRVFPFSDVWVPLGTVRSPAFNRKLNGDLLAVALLAPGADRSAAQAAFQERLGRVPVREVNDMKRVEARLSSFFENLLAELFGDVTSGPMSREGILFFTLAGLAALLFLSIPALNLVNLNLSRTMERTTEIGARKAFGATPGALVRQFLIEYGLLCVLGAVAGLGVAYALLSLVSAADLLPHVRFVPNLRLFGVAAVGALVLSLLSGVYPAWRMARLRPAEALGRR